MTLASDIDPSGTSSQLTIRPVRRDDARDLDALLDRAQIADDYSNSEGRLPTQAEFELATQMRGMSSAGDLIIDRTQRGTDWTFVAENEHGAVAFCHLAESDEPGVVEVQGLYVDPVYWGQGIGKALGAHSISHVIELGHRRFSFETHNQRVTKMTAPLAPTQTGSRGVHHFTL